MSDVSGPLYHVSSSEIYEQIRTEGLRSDAGLFFFDKLAAAEDFGQYWVSSVCGTLSFTIWEVDLTAAQRAELKPDDWFENEQIAAPHEDVDDLHWEYAPYWNEQTGAWAAWHGPTLTTVPVAQLRELSVQALAA